MGLTKTAETPQGTTGLEKKFHRSFKLGGNPKYRSAPQTIIRIIC